MILTILGSGKRARDGERRAGAGDDSRQGFDMFDENDETESSQRRAVSSSIDSGRDSFSGASSQQQGLVESQRMAVSSSSDSGRDELSTVSSTFRASFQQGLVESQHGLVESQQGMAVSSSSDSGREELGTVSSIFRQQADRALRNGQGTALHFDVDIQFCSS